MKEKSKIGKFFDRVKGLFNKPEDKKSVSMSIEIKDIDPSKIEEIDKNLKDVIYDAMNQIFLFKDPNNDTNTKFKYTFEDLIIYARCSNSNIIKVFLELEKMNDKIEDIFLESLEEIRFVMRKIYMNNWSRRNKEEKELYQKRNRIINEDR